MKCPPYVFSALLFFACTTVDNPGESTPPPSDETAADLAIAASDDGGTATDGAGSMMCPMDLAATVSCGRCGTAMQTCADGRVNVGACMGEHGDCAPKETLTTSDGCMIRTCYDNCSGWGPWSYKPPAQCRTGDIDKCPYRGCGLNDEGKKECLAGCKWGPCRC
jgi:hypothetical protein